MNVLTAEFNGVKITVEAPDSADVWEIAKTALESQNTEFSSVDSLRKKKIEKPGYGSKAKAIREVARRVLADGEPHPRKEMARAVREAGFDPQSLNKVLDGHFVRADNGVPAYRDPTVMVSSDSIEVLGSWGGDDEG